MTPFKGITAHYYHHRLKQQHDDDDNDNDNNDDDDDVMAVVMAMVIMIIGRSRKMLILKTLKSVILDIFYSPHTAPGPVSNKHPLMATA